MRLLSPLRHRLVHFARSLERDLDDADDLVADTVLAALESFHRLRNHQAFLAWLFTIATRLHRRRSRRAKLFVPIVADHSEALRARTPAPDVSVDARILIAAMRQLPEKQREAVALFEISGLTIEEIRKIQGGTAGAVKVRLHRGRRRLAELLSADATQPPTTRSSRRSVSAPVDHVQCADSTVDVCLTRANLSGNG